MISTRSMELPRSWGLEEEIERGGPRRRVAPVVVRDAGAGRGRLGDGCGRLSRQQSALISPTAPSACRRTSPSPSRGATASLPAARVELGTEVVGVESRTEGVRAVLRHADGSTRVVHARYLVAADGAYSAVRSALGIAMRGPDHVMEGIIALFRAPLWKLIGDARYGLYAVTHPEAEGLPSPRAEATAGCTAPCGSTEAAADYTEERLTRLIRLAAGAADLRPRFERISSFTATAKLADRFRHASAFLVGDAAHRVTPRGGTGMNTAIHDGYDIGWKLAWVLRGWAGPSCWTRTRRSAGRWPSTTPSGRSTRTGRGARPTRSSHVDLGGRVAHVWFASGAGRFNLDVLGPGAHALHRAGGGELGGRRRLGSRAAPDRRPPPRRHPSARERRPRRRCAARPHRRPAGGPVPRPTAPGRRCTGRCRR